MTSKIVFAAERAIPPWDCDAEASNMSVAAATTLLVMAREPETPWYAYELSRLTGYNTVFLKYVFDRYVARGWLAEVEVTHQPGYSGSGKPRRYFILTSRGRAEVEALRSYLRALAAAAPAVTRGNAGD